MTHEFTIAFTAILLSALAGCLRLGTLRVVLIFVLWLAPLCFTLWFTANFSAEITSEFGAWWAYLAFTPLILAVWATVTLFPFMLAKRLLEIHRQR